MCQELFGPPKLKNIVTSVFCPVQAENPGSAIVYETKRNDREEEIVY